MWAMGGTTEEDKLDRKGAQRVLRRTASYAKPYRRESIIAIVFITLWTLTTIAGPTFVQRGIDDGIRPGNVARLNLAVAGYIIVTIAAYILGRLQIRAVATAGEGFLRDLRVRVFDHLQSQPMAF